MGIEPSSTPAECIKLYTKHNKTKKPKAKIPHFYRKRPHAKLQKYWRCEEEEEEEEEEEQA